MKLFLQSILAITLVLTQGFSAFAELEESVQGQSIVDYLNSNGISQVYSLESHVTLAEFADVMLVKLEEMIKEMKDSGDKKKIEKASELERMRNDLNVDARKLVLALTDEIDQFAKVNEYRRALNIIYSIVNELEGDESRGLLAKILGYTKILGNFYVSVPHPNQNKRNQPVGRKQAEKEAFNIAGPDDFELTPEQIAQLSPLQLGEADVTSRNEWFYTLGELESLERSNDGKAWEANATKFGPTETNDLDKSRRVLVFKKIKDTATSPKMNVEALDKSSWKLKFGEEIHTEPVANALYLAVGGKYQDVVFANKGGLNDLILILEEEEAHKSPTVCSSVKKDKELYAKCYEDSCSKISTLNRFKECLLLSNYKFDVSPYVVESNSVKSNPAVQTQISKIGDVKDVAKYWNRKYIIFNESIVEYAGERSGVAEFGVTSMNRFGAESDRAVRGLTLFDGWIRNKDVKDDNSALVRKEDGQEDIKYQHDNGASLGSLVLAGSVNSLKTSGFLGRLLGSSQIRGLVLYKPRAFKDAQFSDIYWMAKRIGRLSTETIAQTVALSKWPDFVQTALTNRMVLRKNRIVEIYDVGEQTETVQTSTLFPSTPVGGSFVDLSTSENRQRVIRNYGLELAFGGNVESAEKLMLEMMNERLKKNRIEERRNRRKPVFASNQSSIDSFKDGVLVADRNGDLIEIPKCKDSVVVNMLEMLTRPTGLSTRVQRQKDDKPLSGSRCIMSRKDIEKFRAENRI